MTVEAGTGQERGNLLFEQRGPDLFRGDWRCRFLPRRIRGPHRMFPNQTSDEQETAQEPNGIGNWSKSHQFNAPRFAFSISA